MAGEALDIFISYSRRDEGLKDELVDYHLKLLQREGKIRTWQDRDIEAGAEWASEIKANLEKADIILLLITRHFLASDYCYETEMQRAVQRHYDGTARVIPIILEPCGWKYSDFKHLQVLPKDGKPVTTWDRQAEAFFDVEEGIRRVVDNLNAERQKAAAAKAQGSEELIRQQKEAARLEREGQRRESTERAATLRRQKWQTGLCRRRALQIVALGGGSLALGLGVHSRFESTQEDPISPANLSSFECEIVTVNEIGEVAERQTKQADEYQEDLGNGVTLNMVAIPGGEFVMGSPTEEEGRDIDEGPQRIVTVTSFLMGRFQVTQAQYEALMETNPAKFQGANRPVEQVSWDAAVAFCEKLSEHTGRTYRLPSEAEWEYACRAETMAPFHFGPTITTDLANYRGNDWELDGNTYPGNYGKGPKGIFREQTTEVGNFSPNAFGLYDMHGNVLEWCQDAWHDSYEGAPTDGSAWLEGGDQSKRVLRGGSWFFNPVNCRSADRGRNLRDVLDHLVGFRVVWVPA